MKFLLDHQLPLRLAMYLRRRGHDCVCASDLGFGNTDDAAIWAHCIREERVLISKDEDFIHLAVRKNDVGRLVWVRLGNCHNAVLVAAFDRAHDQLIQSLESGRRIVELR